MPTVYTNYFGSAGKIDMLPIRAVSFRDTIADKNISFFNLESESSYKFTPITAPCFDGSTRLLGYKYEGNFYVPHNKLQVLVSKLIGDFTNKSIYTQIALGTLADWELKDPSIDFTESPLLEAINATSGMLIDLGSFTSGIITGLTFEIESVGLRPRTIIKQSGYIDRTKFQTNTFDN